MKHLFRTPAFRVLIAVLALATVYATYACAKNARLRRPTRTWSGRHRLADVGDHPRRGGTRSEHHGVLRSKGSEDRGQRGG